MVSPELIIGYESDGRPVTAACSLCGEWMPTEEIDSLSPTEAFARFGEHFKTHLRQKHPIRDVH
jgi:hypothetical protein